MPAESSAAVIVNRNNAPNRHAPAKASQSPTVHREPREAPSQGHGAAHRCSRRAAYAPAAGSRQALRSAPYQVEDRFCLPSREPCYRRGSVKVRCGLWLGEITRSSS